MREEGNGWRVMESDGFVVAVFCWILVFLRVISDIWAFGGSEQLWSGRQFLRDPDFGEIRPNIWLPHRKSMGRKEKRRKDVTCV